MSEFQIIPKSDEIIKRMSSCRQELLELRRLLRAAQALERAEAAKAARQAPGGMEEHNGK